MNKTILPSQKTDCWICFRNENSVTLSTVNSEKILKHCETYLDTSIFLKSCGSEPLVSCCSYCYKSTHQLTLLEEQIENLRKEISELGLLFSKNVLQRRNRLKKAKNGSANKYTSPTDKHQYYTNHGNQDHHPIDTENNSVVKEDFQSDPIDNISSDSQAKKMDIGEIATEFRFDVDECENFTRNNFEIVNHAENHVDLKYSYNETISEVATNIKMEPSQEISDSTDLGSQQSKRMSVKDLLKSVKMPTIQLHRLQSCRKINSQKFVADDTSFKIRSEINDDDNKCKEEMDNCREETIKCENYLEETQLHKCSVCGHGFTTLNDLQNHDKIHNKNRANVCSFCSKSFQKPSFLKRHLRIHTGERPFTCPYCAKSFGNAENLKRHKLIHFGDVRKFKCSFCEKSFHHSSDAKRHELIHIGNRPHKCHFCSKSFSQSSDMKRHEFIHTGERPYKCSCCEKTFHRKHHLISHHESNHKQRNDELIIP